jgi:elongation factor Tu
MGTTNQIRARIHVLSTAEGGRRNPIYSGYRAGLFLGPDPSVGNDGVVTLEGIEECPPGEDCVAQIALLHPELVKGPLHPTTVFELKEGGRIVGMGTILDLAGGEDYPEFG